MTPSSTGLERAPPRGRCRGMEELTLTPRRSFPSPGAGFQTAAWAPPPVERFDGRPANDAATSESAPPAPLPRWLVILGGAILAAVLGALLGGALAI